jgi:hypothetical protein
VWGAVEVGKHGRSSYSWALQTPLFSSRNIGHGVWLYYPYHLSYRNVEELLFIRGIMVTYEAIRKWCLKFGQTYANQLRRRRPRPLWLINSDVSRSLSMIVAEQPPEAFPTCHLASSLLNCPLPCDQLVVETLMIALHMTMRQILPQNIAVARTAMEGIA